MNEKGYRLGVYLEVMREKYCHGKGYAFQILFIILA